MMTRNTALCLLGLLGVSALAAAAVVKAQPPFALSAVCFSLLNLASGIFASPLIALLGQGLEYFGKVG